MQKFTLNWEELIKLFPGIYLHSGRTDGNGGHHDWLNRTGWGIGSYHYHHNLPAHLHPNGKCAYGELKASIINPFTDKKIDLGMPYYYDDNPYFSLNLVSKALTAHDSMGVELALNNTGGIFYACSTGDSSMSKLGEEFTFSYPKLLLLLHDNTLFETSNGKLRLLCHTKKAALDNIECYAYISLETICDYMTKDGYFTDFSDNGSGVWSFKVREPIVHIISPKNGDAFNVGDEVTVQANIEYVTSARLIIGKVYPMGYIDGFEERKYNLENQSTVIFSKFKLTEDYIGNTAIENGSLDISVRGHTGGTAIDAEIDARTLGDAVSIRIDGLEKEKIEIAPWLIGFKGKPTGTGGRSVTYSSSDWEKLKAINSGIDWYSYERQTGPNQFTSPYLINRQFNVGAYGELTDETDKYWITLGPKVLIPTYPDTGKLDTNEFAPYIGCRVDVILYNEKDDEYAYIECAFSGNIKAHTFNNGIFQTGHPYPNSVSAINEPYEDGYVNGSIVEFTGMVPSTNVSKYSVVELIVYPN